jgi:dTDP-glucose 4,6-dehydratase
MKRLLITGGAGFIGSALVRHALADGRHVCVLDRLTYAGSMASLRAVETHPRFSFVRADVCNRGTVAATLDAFAPDAVLHLAAESHVDRSIDGAAEFVRTNVTGTFEVLEAVRLWPGRGEAFRFLHVSTDEVFGSLGPEGAFDETSRYDPRSPYAASKAASDHFARAWAHTYDLPVIVSNCTNNYGPRQVPEKLIPLMIIHALEGRELPVYGDGRQRRDWLHVDDHARALLTILDKGAVGETYGVGARADRENIGIVERICDLVDEVTPGAAPRRTLIRHVADRPGHDRRYAIDPAKIERDLGWRAQVGFDDGLRATVRWYLDNAAWWRPLRDAGVGQARIGLGDGG